MLSVSSKDSRFSVSALVESNTIIQSGQLGRLGQLGLFGEPG